MCVLERGQSVIKLSNSSYVLVCLHRLFCLIVEELQLVDRCSQSVYILRNALWTTHKYWMKCIEEIEICRLLCKTGSRIAVAAVRVILSVLPTLSPLPV